MTIMARTLWDATATFGLQSAEALASKAWREYERARDADDQEARRDAVLNCAIPAWHVCDWAWASITDAGRTRPEFAQLLGVTGRPTKSDLVSWALRSCPELEICQSICNGTKHVRSERPVATDSKLMPDDKPAKLVVEVGGQEQPIMPILFEAVNFWGLQTTNAGTMC